MTEQNNMTNDRIAAYAAYLRREERAEGTVENYLRALTALLRYLDGTAVTQESINGWKATLMERGYAPVTVNAMLAAINGFCRFMGWALKAKYLKVQRRLFRAPERELTQAEYKRLLQTAHQQKKAQLALLMETICATGIRVSEVQYITVEAAKTEQAEITLKGKIRTILLPGKLCRKLLQYARKQKIASGEIFLTEGGASMGRRRIWRELKALCTHAGVAASKVFPHNLRHLFATTFYRAYQDIVCLADLLGHSSLETTRIYLAVSGAEYRRRLERLGLLS